MGVVALSITGVWRAVVVNAAADGDDDNDEGCRDDVKAEAMPKHDVMKSIDVRIMMKTLY